MRIPALLLLTLLFSTLHAAPDREALTLLLRDLPRWDPTEIPDDPAVEERESAIRSRHGANAEDELYRLKHELLEERFAAYERALGRLAGEDDARVAKALCEVFDTVDERIDEADRARDEAVERWRACVSGWEPGQTNHRLKENQGPTYHRNRTDERIWREFAYGLLGLRLEAAAALASLESEDARDHLLESALPRARSERLRARLARVLSRDRDTSAEPFLDALERERAPGVKAALLAAIGRLEVDDEGLEAVVSELDDRSERVRLAAARALAGIHRVGGVGPLVERLGQERGRTRAEMARALESLTGEGFGAHPDVWQRWWDSRGEGFAQGDLPPRDEESHVRRERPDAEDADGFFYGIPQVSRRILYVIDMSGSMKQDVGGRTRLEACKDELTRAISQLDRRATFNVVMFNNEVTVWSPSMRQAGRLGDEDGSRIAVRDFYGPAQPNGSTNIYDALRRAFELTGVADTGSRAELAADTIYLLTDGSPTTPDGQEDDTGKILEAARKWNELGHVTIHCIAIGKNLNTTFLQALAAEHHGRFIQRD